MDKCLFMLSCGDPRLLEVPVTVAPFLPGKPREAPRLVCFFQICGLKFVVAKCTNNCVDPKCQT